VFACTINYALLLNCCAVNVSIGEAKGHTVLPLPAADTQQPDQTAKDKASINILEKAVVVWSKQIKKVLKSDPDAVLKVSDCGNWLATGDWRVQLQSSACGVGCAAIAASATGFFYVQSRESVN
jgi:hypothetical protein